MSSAWEQVNLLHWNSARDDCVTLRGKKFFMQAKSEIKCEKMCSLWWMIIASKPLFCALSVVGFIKGGSFCVLQANLLLHHSPPRWCILARNFTCLSSTPSMSLKIPSLRCPSAFKIKNFRGGTTVGQFFRHISVNTSVDHVNGFWVYSNYSPQTTKNRFSLMSLDGRFSISCSKWAAPTVQRSCHTFSFNAALKRVQRH